MRNQPLPKNAEFSGATAPQHFQGIVRANSLGRTTKIISSTGSRCRGATCYTHALRSVRCLFPRVVGRVADALRDELGVWPRRDTGS